MVRIPVDSTEKIFARFLITDFRSERSGKQESLVVAPGSGFYVDGVRGQNQIRLAAVLEPPRFNVPLRFFKRLLSHTTLDKHLRVTIRLNLRSSHSRCRVVDPQNYG